MNAIHFNCLIIMGKAPYQLLEENLCLGLINCLLTTASRRFAHVVVVIQSTKTKFTGPAVLGIILILNAHHVPAIGDVRSTLCHAVDAKGQGKSYGSQSGSE